MQYIRILFEVNMTYREQNSNLKINAIICSVNENYTT